MGTNACGSTDSSSYGNGSLNNAAFSSRASKAAPATGSISAHALSGLSGILIDIVILKR
jgi:hypothetical protein